jgi:hypothetical protein
MTRLAIHDLLGISGVRKVVNTLIVSNDDVRLSSLNTREIGAHVDLVNHHLKVDGLARVWIRCLRRVTCIAEQHFAPAAPVFCKRIVTLVAGFCPDDITDYRDWTAVRDPGIVDVVILSSEIKLAQISRPIHRDRVCHSLVVVGREGRREGIRIDALG